MAAGARCLKPRLSKLSSMFDPILVPTWLHFRTKTKQKIIQQSIPRGTTKMIEVGIVFFDHLRFILNAKLGSCWLVFDQNGAALPKSAPFLLRWCFFRLLRAAGRWGSSFLAPRADGVPNCWLHVGAKLAPSCGTWDGLVGLGEA